MVNRSLVGCLVIGMALGLSTVTEAVAQQAPGTVATATPVVNHQRSMVTRQELMSELARLDRDVSSTAYSPALREARRTTADAIRTRLANGDLQPGDLIRVTVVGNAPYSRDYQVSPLRTITFPSGVEISVSRWLRSELSDSLTAAIGQYIREPVVIATASIRLQLSGAVNRNGFFVAPATQLLSTLLMESGGGPARNANYPKSEIRRGPEQIVLSGEEFETALKEGHSLDILNIQAGDEIHIAEKPSSSVFYKVLGAASAIGGLVYLFRQIF